MESDLVPNSLKPQDLASNLESRDSCHRQMIPFFDSTPIFMVNHSSCFGSSHMCRQNLRLDFPTWKNPICAIYSHSLMFVFFKESNRRNSIHWTPPYDHVDTQAGWLPPHGWSLSLAKWPSGEPYFSVNQKSATATTLTRFFSERWILWIPFRRLYKIWLGLLLNPHSKKYVLKI